jgi:hypothetical protein
MNLTWNVRMVLGWLLKASIIWVCRLLGDIGNGTVRERLARLTAQATSRQSRHTTEGVGPS